MKAGKLNEEIRAKNIICLFPHRFCFSQHIAKYDSPNAPAEKPSLHQGYLHYTKLPNTETWDTSKPNPTLF